MNKWHSKFHELVVSSRDLGNVLLLLPHRLFNTINGDTTTYHTYFGCRSEISLLIREHKIQSINRAIGSLAPTTIPKQHFHLSGVLIKEIGTFI